MTAARPFTRPLTVYQNPSPPSGDATASDARAHFERDGLYILRHAVEAKLLSQITQRSRELLREQSSPVEFESRLHSPGAPNRSDPAIEKTPRRLRALLARDPLYIQWAQHPALRDTLKRIAWPKAQTIFCSRNHHNCLMTKMPQRSSETGWHQDLRYWNFRHGDLITAWLALGPERQDNGALQVIPGSHRQDFAAEAFDSHKFFRGDDATGQSWLQRAQCVELQAGDVLFFHCRLLHAALPNREDAAKLAVVLTFRRDEDEPVPGTRSAGVEDLEV